MFTQWMFFMTTTFKPQMVIDYLEDVDGLDDSYGVLPKLRRAAYDCIEFGRDTWEEFIEQWKSRTGYFLDVDVSRASSLVRWLRDEKDVHVEHTDEQKEYVPSTDKQVRFDKHTLAEVRVMISNLESQPAQVLYLLASCGIDADTIELIDGPPDGLSLHLTNGTALSLMEDEAEILDYCIRNGDALSTFYTHLSTDKRKKREQRNGIWNYLLGVQKKADFPYSYMEVFRIWELDAAKRHGPYDAAEVIHERCGTAPRNILKRWTADYPGKRISPETMRKVFG